MSVEEKIRKARAGLVLDQPFFGSLALRMEIKDAGNQIPTIGTDGVMMVYNPEFIKSLTALELKGVLCHEVMHVVLLHHLRREGRDPELWNIAADYAINPILTDADFTLTKGCLLEDRFRDKSADEIYKILLKEQPPKQKQPQGGGTNSDPGGCGQVMDYPGQPSEAEKTKAEQMVKMAVIQAAKQAEARGTLPGSIKRVVGELTNPVICWRSLLRRFIQETSRNDFTWSRPNRRFLGHGIYLPSLRSDELKPVCLAIDTSGSIDNQTLNDFASELNSILEEYESKISVLYCDTMINKAEEYSRDDLPLHLKPVGGGGTSFIPPFKWIEKHNKDIACMIYFTDLQCNDFPDQPSYPVLWMQHGDYGNDVPFGEIIKLK
jgi:predicted metal-dependent peptidase